MSEKTTLSSTTPITEVTSFELHTVARNIIDQMEDGNTREVLGEVVRRFTDYEQTLVETGHIPEDKEKKLSRHMQHIDALKKALWFFNAVSQILSQHGLIDWRKPFEETHLRLHEHLDEMREKPLQIIAIIREIYCAGGVRFSRDALPEQIRISVTNEMKARGIIPK